MNPSGKTGQDFLCLVFNAANTIVKSQVITVVEMTRGCFALLDVS
ncbi:hypothetical protein [Chitinophaga sp. CF118]|nr:hypothetical protein [Chitinophaga sp. CF118]